MGLRTLSEDMVFEDRQQAGELLARELRASLRPNPLLLAIPRSGVVIAGIIAKRLSCELDILASRKLRAPLNPELAIGAVMEGGETYLNEPIISEAGIAPSYIQKERKKELSLLRQMTAKYRKVLSRIDPAGRNLILVDDGVATGATMISAIQGLKQAKPMSITVALPVGSPDTLVRLSEMVDDVVCLCAPRVFWAVGQVYRNFGQVSDGEVIRILEQGGR